MNWLMQNKSWVFSGIGATVVALIFNIFYPSSNVSSLPVTPQATKPSKESSDSIVQKKDALVYHKYEIEDGSYLYSSKEPLRALYFYKEALNFDSSLFDEVQHTMQAQKKKILELESKDAEKITSEEKSRLQQLKNNLHAFELLDQKLKELISVHQKNLADLTKLSLGVNK